MPSNIVRACRSDLPDIINIRVEELTGDQLFDDLTAEFLSRNEPKEMSDIYKRVAGFGLVGVLR